MDIVIKNGKISQEESQIYFEKKNELGNYKKDFKYFINGESGPYYDLYDGHLCIPRKYNKIANFHGPQDPLKIKIDITKDFDKKSCYCSICHKKIIRNFSFDPKRRLQEVDYDLFRPKEKSQKSILDLSFSLHQCKIIDNENDNLIELCDKVNNIKIISWYEITCNLVTSNRTQKLILYKLKRQKILNNYFKLVYKILYKPIIYNISHYENKLIWPWNLTNFQYFVLNYPDYKESSAYSHTKSHKIDKKYVMIE